MGKLQFNPVLWLEDNIRSIIQKRKVNKEVRRCVFFHYVRTPTVMFKTVKMPVFRSILIVFLCMLRNRMYVGLVSLI